MKKLLVLSLAFLLIAGLPAFAGDAAAGGAPKILRISHYEVKPGKMATHDALVRQVREALNTGNANYHWIAAQPMTGNSNETVFINFYDNYAEFGQRSEEIGKAAQATFQRADFIRDVADSQESTHGIIAKLRADLSYNPQKLDIAHARQWEVSLVRLKPGTEMEFADLEKEAIELHKRGNIDEHWVTYEVQYGTAGPAFIFIRSLKTLADLDVDLKDAHKAVFNDTIRRRFSAVARESVTYEKSQILRVRPEISRPSETLVAANPDFWTVKEEPTAVATKGKAKPKTAVQPAAMKSEEKPKN